MYTKQNLKNPLTVRVELFQNTDGDFLSNFELYVDNGVTWDEQMFDAMSQALLHAKIKLDKVVITLAASAKEKNGR